MVIAQNPSSIIFLSFLTTRSDGARRQRSAQLNTYQVRQNVMYSIESQYKQVHSIRKINRFNYID